MMFHVLKKYKHLLIFCNANGKKIKGKFTNINPHTFQKLLAQLKLEGSEEIIYKSLAIRSMPKSLLFL